MSIAEYKIDDSGNDQCCCDKLITAEKECDRLKKENEELREDIKKAVNTGDRAMIIAKENINLKSRIDRAVDWIDNNLSGWTAERLTKILAEGDK
jgi:hypothetical protein